MTQDLHIDLLKRRIETIKDAANRKKNIWATATLLTFVIATAIYNNTLSHNISQVINRAIILSAVSKPFSVLNNTLSSGVDATNNSNYKSLIIAVLKMKESKLGYLGYMVPENSNFEPNDETIKALRSSALSELQSYINRSAQFDTVQIPFIGVNIAATDIGIIGGLGLSIIGYWLLIALRRENESLKLFIHKVDKRGKYTTIHSGYSEDESAYAYYAINQYLIFCNPSRKSAVNYLTLASFLFPPGLLLFNHLETFKMILETSGAVQYFQPHCIIELATAISAFITWILALLYQYDTVKSLIAWSNIVDIYIASSNNDELTYVSK